MEQGEEGWRGGFSEMGWLVDEVVVGRRMLPWGSLARGRHGKRVLRRVDILVDFGEVLLVFFELGGCVRVGWVGE